MRIRAKRLFALACITLSTLTFAGVGIVAANDAATTFTAYLHTLEHVLAGGGL